MIAWKRQRGIPSIPSSIKALRACYRDLLGRYVPIRYAVETGFVVNAYGHAQHGKPPQFCGLPVFLPDVKARMN